MVKGVVKGVGFTSMSLQEASRMYNKKEDPVALRFKVVALALGKILGGNYFLNLSIHRRESTECVVLALAQNSAIKWKSYAPTLVALGNKVPCSRAN
jgi:hypothetical protein